MHHLKKCSTHPPTPPKQHTRNPTLDIARGISILLVVFAHSGLAQLFPESNQTLALFRMPFFFFLAGVCLTSQGTLNNFAAKKTDTLLKPYIVTVLAVSLLPPLARGESLWVHWMGGLYGTGQSLVWTPLWFLTHLWVASLSAFLYFYGLNRFLKKSSKKYRFIVIVSSLIVLMAVSNPLLNKAGEIGWPWSIDLLPISLFFMLLGRAMADRIKAFAPHNMMLIIALVGLFLAKSQGAFVSLNYRAYSPLIWATVAALCGIYCLLTLAFYINHQATRLLASSVRLNILSIVLIALSQRFKIALTFMGRNSLYILLFHSLMLYYARNLLESWGINGIPVAFHTLSIVIAVALCLLIKTALQAFTVSRWLYFPKGATSNCPPIQQTEQAIWRAMKHLLHRRQATVIRR